MINFLSGASSSLRCFAPNVESLSCSESFAKEFVGKSWARCGWFQTFAGLVFGSWPACPACSIKYEFILASLRSRRARSAVKEMINEILKNYRCLALPLMVKNSTPEAMSDSKR
jgi:hypothetical protein